MARAKQRAESPALVPVVIRDGAVVYHDGRSYLAGDRLELAADDAKSLAAQGVAIAPTAYAKQRKQEPGTEAEPPPPDQTEIHVTADKPRRIAKRRGIGPKGT